MKESEVNLRQKEIKIVEPRDSRLSDEEFAEIVRREKEKDEEYKKRGPGHCPNLYGHF